MYVPGERWGLGFVGTTRHEGRTNGLCCVLRKCLVAAWLQFSSRMHLILQEMVDFWFSQFPSPVLPRKSQFLVKKTQKTNKNTLGLTYMVE
jgi:hypothetical protein